ncbi:MAG: hypothetical protein GY777_22125 [Candidatus Brocadiaceae bacterium]|nr:hypothetical protein [Candidatus Brocadiaceae bacterium]
MRLESIQYKSEQEIMEVILTGDEIWGPLYDMFRNRIPIDGIEPSSVKSLLEAVGSS